MTGWNAPTATYTYFLPEGQGNVSGYEALQFRAGVNFTDARNFHLLPGPFFNGNPPPPFGQDLTITMRDGTGKTASVKVSQAAPGALFIPPGSTTFLLPKSVLTTVRVPLTHFFKLDLSNIEEIDFKFDRESTGAIMITDIAFTSIPPSP